MLLGTPTFSAHLPLRSLFEDATGYMPDPAVESRYADRVDEAAGIVYGIKILGLESRNTPRTIGETYETMGEYLDVPYCYSLEALRDAVELFEGIKVLIDHPDFQYTRLGERFAPPKERSVKENFGRIVNVRVTTDGMYGDHEYLKSEPFSTKYVEVVRRMPNVLAFSPACNGVLRIVNAKPKIVKITDVRSVDLVGERPGTTSSLFESASLSNMADTKKPDTDTGKQNPDLGAAPDLHEDDSPTLTAGADTTSAMAEDAAPAAPDHFDAAFEKEVMDIWAGEGSPQDKASKIAKLAKQQEAIAGIRGKNGDDTSGDDDEDDDLDLEETEANPSAASDSAATGKEGIAPAALSETSADANDKTAEEAKKLAESKGRSKMHETAALQSQLSDARRKLSIAKDRLKRVRAEAHRREEAIYESADLLNEAGKPVRSGTLRVISREPDQKARRRFIAESVAARPMQQPRSQESAPGAAKPLHETTAQGAPSAGGKLAEALAKNDGAAIASMLRTGVVT